MVHLRWVLACDQAAAAGASGRHDAREFWEEVYIWA